MKQIIEEDGPWSAHDIRLGEGLSTLPENPQWSADGVRRIFQIASDICRKPWSGLSLLDLGCLEGLYAIEAGARGAQALGIELRPQNLRKAEFARDALSLKNVRFLQEDVRGLSAKKHGVFDIVVCSGLLYHLEAEDVFSLIRALREVTGTMAVIDTHIALSPDRTERDGDHLYHGSTYREHPDGSDADAHLVAGNWASVGNTTSFWLTKPSLLSALRRAGFTSVMEVHMPFLTRAENRLTLVAIAGTEQHSAVTDEAALSPDVSPEK